MAHTFLLNIADIDAPLPYEIVPGHCFDRATEQQCVEMRHIVGMFTDDSWMLPGKGFSYQVPSPYESVICDSKYVPLEPRKYRYFVLNYVGNNATEDALRRASLLLPNESEIVFGSNVMEASDMLAFGFKREDLVGDGRAGGGNLLELNAFFNRLRGGNRNDIFLRITHEALVELRKTFDRLLAHDENIFALRSIINNLNILRDIDPRSRLRFVGYMAIIESLLSHEPDPKDPHESIQKQIKRKMNLLDHRIPGGFGYSSLSTKAPDKIWSELYSIRSAIAHGGEPNPKLIEYNAGLLFIKEVAKKVIRYALEEPVLIRDLRAC